MNAGAGEVRYDDLAGVCVRPLRAAGLVIKVEEAHAREADVAARVERAWQEHRRTHPRDYDGMILDVRARDIERGEVVARRERYRYLAVGHECGVHVSLLAVTGVVTGVDQDGDECVLLGRRSAETRIYGGLWELGPSGGVKCPGESVRQIGLAEVRRGLVDEGIEELGVSLEGAESVAVALVEDEQAASEDVLLRVRLRETINSVWAACRAADHGAWEYADTAWVPIKRMGAWVRERPGAMIPPSVAVVRWLGWA